MRIEMTTQTEIEKLVDAMEGRSKTRQEDYLIAALRIAVEDEAFSGLTLDQLIMRQEKRKQRILATLKGDP